MENKSKHFNITVVVGVFPIISETFIVNQIVSLIDDGHQVEIYALNRGDFNTIHDIILKYKLLDKVYFHEKYIKNRKARLYYFLRWMFTYFFKINWLLFIKSFNIFKYGKKAWSLKLFYQLQFFLIKKQIDIVHVHFGVNAKPFAELKKIGFLEKSKLIVSFHGFDLNPSKIDFYKSQYKGLLEQAEYLTVNTIYTKEIILKIDPKLNNVIILPESLNTNLFQQKQIKNQTSKKFRIVYCGRLVPFKGGNLLPLIIKELLNRGINNINLKIIGSGELKKSIEEDIARLNLNNIIELVGAKTQDDIIEIFNNSNVFLLPGVYDEKDGRAENQGLVIQEAQAMELPVVVSDVGGMKYGLVPNETGFLVTEKDIKGFANALQKIIENPFMAKNMGRKGRTFVKEKYDSKVLLKQLLEIYKDTK